MNAKKLLAPALVTALILGTNFVPAQEADAANDTAPGQLKKVVYDKSGAPAFVNGVLSEKKEQAGAAAAIEVLEQNKEFFRMKSPKTSLKEKKTEKDALGMTHVRLQQTKNGLPVENAEMIVHFDADNVATTVNGEFNTQVDELDLDTAASLSSEEALVIAKQAVSAPDKTDYEPTSELVVYPSEDDVHVAYKVNVNFLGEKPGNWFVYIDAKTGSVVDKYNALMDLDQHQDLKPSTATGIGVKGDKRQLHVSHSNDKQDGEGTTFYLHDISHPNLGGIITYDFKNQWRSSTVQLPGEVFADKDASWKDDYQRAAVDAHYNSEKVYDYFLNKHNRNSIDGNGMAIISTVHYGDQYNNAFWNGHQMTYGDGDGKFMISLSAGLDVAAHEMAHGVTTHSAGLLYRFESGALNESYSDIFGALVDDDEWEVGDDIMAADAIATGRTALRSMSDPTKFPVNAAYTSYGDGSGKYPKHMNSFYNLPLSLDNGGVHVNSSIWNHAAYLIGEELGRDKLGKIYYRTLTQYLTPTSSFADARVATIQSAVDLYGAGSAEEQAVKAGLDAVGITE